MEVLGIDFGGSGIKGAPVDTETGVLLAPRLRVPTPDPSEPGAVAETVEELVDNFRWKGPIGFGVPSAVRQGVVLTASNIHEDWIGVDAVKLIGSATGCPTYAVNDADAAGLAEMAFGAGRGRIGTVIMVTIGTGLGTALFTNGHLLPNCELGHIEIKGKDAEASASDAARKRENMSWKKWSKKLNRYLGRLEALFWPDLFILGGGVSKDHEKFLPLLTVQAEVVPAQFLNEAGIVGTALAAALYQGDGGLIP